MNAAGSTDRVGAVILHWRRQAHTIRAIESILSSQVARLDLLVVSNGPEPQFAAELRQRFPSITVVENRYNLGFAGGNNVGIHHLMSRGSDLLLLLNDDAEVAADTINCLARAARANPSAAALGPTILYRHHPLGEVIWSAGGRIDALGEAQHLRLDELDAHRDGHDWLDVDYVSGCVMLLRASVIEKIGALDERFFAYFEEAEWCARARRAGYRAVLVPGARAWHDVAPSDRDSSKVSHYLMTRNRLLYLKLTATPRRLILHAALRAIRRAVLWRCSSRHTKMRPYATALARAVLDFALGRHGPPPSSLEGPG
jgi:hypothetical protein